LNLLLLLLRLLVVLLPEKKALLLNRVNLMLSLNPQVDLNLPSLNWLRK
jgi:hypothetical protein